MIKSKLWLAFATVLFFWGSSVFASTIEVFTIDNANFGGSDSQGPVESGSISSTTIDGSGSGTDFSGSAMATATADVSGKTGALAEGLYACGSCNFDLSAESFFSTSYTNTTGSDINFTYDFLINGPSIEIWDYAFVDESSGLGAQAQASVYMETSGGVTDELRVNLEMVGGRAGHTLTTSDATLTSSTGSGSNFGYQMGDISGSFSGFLAVGETVTVDSWLYAAIFGPGWELGARASIGDPNNLSTNPFGGVFDITELDPVSVSPVPIPAAGWLFITGLVGMAGISRRQKRTA